MVLKLQLREIGQTLSDDSQSDPVTSVRDERQDWHDSSLELERGLEVIELSVDLLLADLERPATP